jgi:hypothetical protein
MRAKTKESHDVIMDVIGGSNGGVDFVHYLNFLNVMDDRAAKGDKAAEQVVDIMVKYSRLIQLALKNSSNHKAKV